MGFFVYILCALTSVACTLLLGRAYLRTRSRLLLWSAACFVGLAANNILLFVDLVLTPPALDLSWLRALTALGSVALLLYGLIWDAQ
jgi:hypothetical protein